MAINDSIRAGSSGSASFYDVSHSIRFYRHDDPQLYRTPTSTSSSYTVSIWLKNSQEDTTVYQTFWNNMNNGNTFNFSNVDQLRMTRDNHHHTASTSYYRDCAHWYHFVFKNNNGTGTCFMNGQEVPNLTSPSANPLATTNYYRIGWGGSTGGEFTWDGLIAQAALIDGSALDPSSFAETNPETGQWVPKDLSALTFGTDGYWLQFDDSTDLGKDTSGNSNNFTVANLDANDMMLDTPTNNFVTLSPRSSNNIDLEEGGLIVRALDGAWRTAFGTHTFSSGKWYWEARSNNKGSYQIVGMIPKTRTSHLHQVNMNNDYYPGTGSDEYGYETRGKLYNTANPTNNWGDTWTTGDIMGVALDADNNTLKFYKNNTQQGSTINITSEEKRACFTSFGSSSRLHVNFGQDSSFAGNETRQNNSDGNGQGDFYYTPPSGYLAACSKNFSPSIKLPQKHFDIVTWDGNGNDNRDISGLEFQPDLVWVKRRNATSDNILVDAVRGNSKYVISNEDDAEATDSNLVQAFNSDGFQIGTDNTVNNSSGTYVAWCWNAGGSNASNTSGTLSSTVRANPTAGFSIVKYTGNSTNSQNVGHGLGVPPNLIFAKNLDTTDDWQVYWNVLTTQAAADHGQLNKSAAFNSGGQGGSANDKWGDGTVSSTVFSVGGVGDSYTNGNGHEHIAYCFSKVEGYQDIGIYRGNGNTDGAYVMTGFKPALVMIKQASGTRRWIVYDTKRNTYNQTNNELYWSLDSSENASDSHTGIDIVSNGFRCTANNIAINGNGSLYIYLAIAEQPWSLANAR